MKAIERHRQSWQGKSDEWLFERLDNELKQKVEEIHRLLAENETLRQLINDYHESEVKKLNIPDVSRQSELLFAFIKAIKEEFADQNWDYLDFIADRVIGKQ